MSVKPALVNHVEANLPEQAANRLGLVVSELTAEQKRELKMSSGLLIEDVRGTSGRADLRPG
jgi:serine protease Do